MKKVSFECSDESVALFVDIIDKLNNASVYSKSIKIRIGGSEYCFTDGIDDVGEPLVDDNHLDSSERMDYVDVRINALKSIAPQPIAPPIVSSSGGQDDADGGNASPSVSNSGSKLSDDDKETIKGIVLDWTDDSRMFTAHDVTKEARAKGMWIEHKDSKAVVEEMFSKIEMADYDRTIVDVGAKGKPFVYHPQVSDPTSYSAS